MHLFKSLTLKSARPELINSRRLVPLCQLKCCETIFDLADVQNYQMDRKTDCVL